jgi:hypothetical protein
MFWVVMLTYSIDYLEMAKNNANRVSHKREKLAHCKAEMIEIIAKRSGGEKFAAELRIRTADLRRKSRALYH